VLDGDPTLPSKKGTAPNFWPMSIVAKSLDGSIKMPLGTEVGFGPGGFVLDGDPASPPKKVQPHPILSPYL